jgi:DNA primase large subunit
MLFRLRFGNDDLKERGQFVEGLGLDWETVTSEEKMELEEELRAANGWQGKNGRVVVDDEEGWFKVDWERVPELVEGRKVFLKAGKAYVPGKEQGSMVVAEFTQRLDRALEVCLSLFLVLSFERDDEGGELTCATDDIPRSPPPR